MNIKHIAGAFLISFLAIAVVARVAPLRSLAGL